MKLQIRTLSVQERKELYTQALEYFSKPKGDRRDELVGGVCEYLHRIFYFRKISSDWGTAKFVVEKGLRSLSGEQMPVNLGKELMPELYRRKTKKESHDDFILGYYWFNDDQERIAALQACIEDTSHITEEDDEQGVKVYAEFDTDWEPQA